MRDILDLLESKSKPEKLTTEPLPYGEGDLAPVLSRESINYHYEHLAKGYAKRYNAGEGDADFNEAGSFLHNLFFPQLKKPSGSNRPKGALLNIINARFKSFDDFKTQFGETAMKIEGSGWVYLSTDGVIKTIKNHEIRKDICVLVDWWEHAWALDYEWDKAKYLKNMWRIIDWEVCNRRL